MHASSRSSVRQLRTAQAFTRLALALGPAPRAGVGHAAGVAFTEMRPDELERRIQERLDALGPAPRAELLHVLMLPDFERVDRIGEFWGYRRAGPSPSS